MSKGLKVLFIALAVAGIAALSFGSVSMANGNDSGNQIRDRVDDCDETCQQCLQASECNQTPACLNEQQQLCEQNENCVQTAEQNHTRLNWQDDTCPSNALGQQDESETKGNRFGQD